MLGAYRIPSFFLIIILPFSFMKIEASCLKPSLLQWLPNGRFSNLINSSIYISRNFTLRKCVSFSVYLFMTHCDSLNWVIIHSYHLFCCSTCLSFGHWYPCPSFSEPLPYFLSELDVLHGLSSSFPCPSSKIGHFSTGPFCYRMAFTVAFWGEDVPISSLSHGFLMIDEE